MLLWIILTAMTLAAAAWLAAPLLRRFDGSAGAASELEVYRDQLAEVEREQAEGAIDADQAVAAGLEIKRRMLAAQREQTTANGQLSLGERHMAVVGIAAVVGLGSVILYSNAGRPDLPSVARAPTTLVLGDRLQGPSFRSARGDAATPVAAAQPGAAVGGPPTASPPVAQQATAPGAPPLGSVDDMIQRLVDRLKKDPINVETWRMLGWSYFATERYAEAADAYRKATELQPKNASLLTSYGEALVRAADGQVKPEAVAVFDAALALEPKDPRARFFKGLVREQGGDKRGALDAWIAVLGDATADDDWAPDLRARIVELAGALGIDVTSRLPAAPAAAASLPTPAAPTGGVLQALKDRGAQSEEAAAAPGKGPTAEAVKAAESVTPADRTAMIRGMVEGLAQRLETSPRDADGWIQLIRSRKVLGEADAAKTALAKALAAFADTPLEQTRIAAAAREMGVTP